MHGGSIPWVRHFLFCLNVHCTKAGLGIKASFGKYKYSFAGKSWDKKAAEQERKAREDEVRANEFQTKHEKAIAEAESKWKTIADKKDWTQVIANLDVYKFSGQAVITEDPRRSQEYRQTILKELGFGPDCTRKDLTPEDLAAIRNVISEKAAAFWSEGTPRTVLRHLKHYQD